MLDPKKMDIVLERRLGAKSAVEGFRAKNKARINLQGKLDGLRADRNAANKRMAQLSHTDPAFEDERTRLRDLSKDIKEGEDTLETYSREALAWHMEIPNAPHDDVPQGTTEEHNQIEHVWGKKPSFTFEPKAHWDVGETLGILDPETAAQVSGARFTFLRRDGARLNRALISFMLDIHVDKGYQEIWPPALVRRVSLEGTGQLPKFADGVFPINSEHDIALSPTAEVQLVNMHRDQILEAEQLPLSYVAYAPCFRSEAGSYGSDTRGLLRQHQFDKVELVKFATPDTSYQELDSLRQDAEHILQALDLHYRVVTLCTGDLGFAAAKTFDIEVWLPGQQLYREISSCSNCEDFQTRRSKIRYRSARGEKTQYPHTLNGSGLAVGRTIVAILEQCQQPDGTVKIPKNLQPYMNGVTVLTPP